MLDLFIVVPFSPGDTAQITTDIFMFQNRIHTRRTQVHPSSSPEQTPGHRTYAWSSQLSYPFDDGAGRSSWENHDHWHERDHSTNESTSPHSNRQPKRNKPSDQRSFHRWARRSYVLVGGDIGEFIEEKISTGRFVRGHDRNLEQIQFTAWSLLKFSRSFKASKLIITDQGEKQSNASFSGFTIGWWPHPIMFGGATFDGIVRMSVEIELIDQPSKKSKLFPFRINRTTNWVQIVGGRSTL